MSRKLLILWMLLAAPLLQARTLMHCEMMGEVAMSADCCCEGGESEMAAPGGDETCCEVVAVTDSLPDGVKAANVDEEFDAYQAQAPPSRMPSSRRPRSGWISICMIHLRAKMPLCKAF